MDIGHALEARWARLPELRIGQKTARLPIVQGGMGVCLSLANLAAAVAAEGGIGVIAATGIGMLEDDYYANPVEANLRALRGEIQRARRKTGGLIGVNIMVAADCFLQMLQVAVEEKVDVLFLGAGLPIKGIPVSAIRQNGVSVVPIVSSGRAARLIFKSWEKFYRDIPDAVVVEGPLAGGHLGFKPEQIEDPAFRLEKILPDVVEAVREFEARWGRDIPVIAAGGVFTGEDIHRLLKLGAKGVQLGTRFIATHECDADIRFKQAYLACAREDIVIIQSPVGLPGRAIRSRFLDDVARGLKKHFRCPSHCLESCGAKKARYCIAEALDSARRGNFDDGFAFCGANAHRVTAIVSVKELITALKQGFVRAGVVGAIKAECARVTENIAALKEEYSLILSLARESFRDGVRRMSVENKVKFREEKDRLRQKLVDIRSDYLKAKARRRELNSELRELLNGLPCPDPA